MLSSLHTNYGYHNWNHTVEVFIAAEYLGRKVRLADAEIEVLQLAALFHDVGYIEGAEHHERTGARLAAQYLKEVGFDAERTAQVERCILATEVTIEPVNQLEEIMCDADLSYLGTVDFFDKAKVLRKEWEITLNKCYDELEWLEVNIQFLEAHQFYTEGAQHHYDAIKKAHLRRLKEQRDELQSS